jgi:RND family efflux transporter MFP subunit
MKKAIFIGVPFIMLLVLVGWRYMQKTETNKQLGQRASGLKNGPANVVLATVGPRPVTLTYEAVGTVESPYTVELSPKLTGKIVFLPDYLREGYNVKKGQLLCQIDPTETLGQVLQAKSQLAQAESTLVSAKLTQHPTNVNVSSQISQAVATVDSNKADYDQVKENYQAQVHQAHSMVIDSQAKVDAAKAAVNNAIASMGSATASLEDAQSKLNRENTLYKQGYVAAQDVDDAVAAQKVAKANVDVADGLVKSARSAEQSSEAELRSAEDNESIVKKTGDTNIRAAWAKVVLAKAALKYSESTLNLKPAYAAQLEADQAAVDAAKGNLNQANARLADCSLVSTIDGTVSKRNADIGTVVNAGASILEVQYTSWLYVTSAIPIEYTGRIVKGTPVTMTFDSLSGLKLDGTVTELSAVADPQSRQFNAQVRIDNAAGKFRAGMYARVHFLVSKKTFPVAVAREAIHTSNTTGVSTATVVDKDNVAHIVTVTTGEQDTNNIAISDGLKPGDRVVIISYVPVRDKQKVVEGGVKRRPAAGGTNPNLPTDQTPEGNRPRPGTGQGASMSSAVSGAKS